MAICPSCAHDNHPGVDYCDECGYDMHQVDGLQPHGGLQAKILTNTLAMVPPRTPDRLSASDTVADATTAMRKSNHGCVLIVEGNELTGLMTERDLLMRPWGTDRKPEEIKLEEVMIKEPEFLNEKDSIAFALHKMSLGEFRHLPVVSEGAPPKIVSIRDILKHLLEGNGG